MSLLLLIGGAHEVQFGACCNNLLGLFGDDLVLFWDLFWRSFIQKIKNRGGRSWGFVGMIWVDDWRVLIESSGFDSGKVCESEGELELARFKDWVI